MISRQGRRGPSCPVRALGAQSGSPGCLNTPQHSGPGVNSAQSMRPRWDPHPLRARDLGRRLGWSEEHEPPIYLSNWARILIVRSQSFYEAAMRHERRAPAAGLSRTENSRLIRCKKQLMQANLL